MCSIVLCILNRNVLTGYGLEWYPNEWRLSRGAAALFLAVRVSAHTSHLSLVGRASTKTIGQVREPVPVNDFAPDHAVVFSDCYLEPTRAAADHRPPGEQDGGCRDGSSG